MNSGKKHAFVVGASRGIGRETALSLAANGWETSVLARDLQALQTVQNSCSSKNIVSVHSCDIGREEDIASFAHEWGERKLDLVVLNASLGLFKPVLDLSSSELSQVLDVNIKGITLMAKTLIPSLSQSSCPRIVIVTSDVARRTFANGGAYCMTKYAQDALALTLRKELRPLGVRVSVVMPGLVDTSFGDGVEGAPHKVEWLRAQDIAETIKFIASAPDHVVIDEIMVHPFCQDYQL